MLPHPDLINDADVMALLDGTASPQILAHYDQCRACRAYVVQQRQIEESLHQFFSGDSCPSGKQITAFVRGKLARQQQDTIEAHIDGCEACKHDSEEMHLFFQQPKPATPQPSFQAGWSGMQQSNIPWSAALPTRQVPWQKKRCAGECRGTNQFCGGD